MGRVYSLRCWPFKHEDVSQSPRITYKSQNMKDHWKARGIQLSLLCELQVSMKPWLKNICG